MLELVHDLCTAVASSLYTSFYSLPRIATKIQDQVHTAVAVRSYSCNRTTSYSSDTYRTGLLRSHSCTLHDHEHVYTAPSEPASTCTNMDPLCMLLLPAATTGVCRLSIRSAELSLAWGGEDARQVGRLHATAALRPCLSAGPPVSHGCTVCARLLHASCAVVCARTREGVPDERLGEHRRGRGCANP